MHRFGLGALGLAVLVIAGGAHASDATDASVDLNLEVLPFAQFEFLDDPLLSLTVPPSGSTIPGMGVDFRVIGNTSASLVAEPSGFVEISRSGGSQFLGAAVSEGNTIGYDIELRFPAVGAPNSPRQLALLPGFEAGPTAPALEVDLAQTGMQRTGQIHLIADPAWTQTGNLPLPGSYLGEVTLTLSSD